MSEFFGGVKWAGWGLVSIRKGLIQCVYVDGLCSLGIFTMGEGNGFVFLLQSNFTVDFDVQVSNFVPVFVSFKENALFYYVFLEFWSN